MQETIQYHAESTGSRESNIFPVASDTKYANSDGSGAETTTYAYSWFSGTVQMQSETISEPTVYAAQNGAGTSATTTNFF